MLKLKLVQKYFQHFQLTSDYDNSFKIINEQYLNHIKSMISFKAYISCLHLDKSVFHQ